MTTDKGEKDAGANAGSQADGNGRLWKFPPITFLSEVESTVIG